MSSSIPPAGDGTGQPEYLEQGSGSPLPDDGAASGGGGRRRALAVGGGLAALALVGAGAWAAVSFFATGAQPAEALPDSTLGYVSIDLDPSGGQKLEALRMLKKFPAIADEIDLDTDDDLKEQLFDELGLADSCEGLTYADDVEPWLGDRAAMAVIDLGEDEPTVAAVVQVSDAAEAESGLDELQECGGGEAGGDEGGWAIADDWAVVAESTAVAERIVDEAAKGALGDDSDYRTWTDEVGDPGVFTVYVAPEAGAYLADSLDGLLGFGPMSMPMGYSDPCPFDPSASTEEMHAAMVACGEDAFDDTAASGEETPSELADALGEFGGMAMVVRFDDGGIELEYAGDASPFGDEVFVSDTAGDVMATLPDDTAVALGLSLTEGWFDQVLEQMAGYSGGLSIEEMVEQAEQETGLALPEDAVTLAGESAAVALGGDFDPETVANSATGSDVPFGIKVRGDAVAIESVLDKLRATVPANEVEIASASDGDLVAFGPNLDYVAEILDEGRLGDLGAYRAVVAEADRAGAILFVNFDAGDWLDSLAAGDPELAENLRPLAALGISGWVDGDVSHGVLRLTTS